MKQITATYIPHPPLLALLTLILCMLILTAGAVHAGGNREVQEFRSRQAELFEQAVPDLASGRISARELQSEMEELRLGFGIPYSDEAGILDALIDGIHQGRIPAAEGLLFYEMLEDGSLSRYRQASRLEQNEAKRARIISDLAKFTEDSNTTPDAPSLQNYLNNLYRLTAMEYDQLYEELSGLITAYGNEEVNRTGFLADIRRLSDSNDSGTIPSNGGPGGFQGPSSQEPPSDGSPLPEAPIPETPDIPDEQPPSTGPGSGGSGQRPGGS